MNPVYPNGDVLDRIYSKVSEERRRQYNMLREKGIPHDCAHPEVDMFRKLSVLAEEQGEVHRAHLENDVVQLRTELIQLMAVAAAILESTECKVYESKSSVG